MLDYYKSLVLYTMLTTLGEIIYVGNKIKLLYNRRRISISRPILREWVSSN